MKYTYLFVLILFLNCTKSPEKTHIEFSYDNAWKKSYSFIIDTNDKVYLKTYFPYEKAGKYEITVNQNFINNFKIKLAELKLDANTARYYQAGLSDGTAFQIYKESKADTLSVYVYGEEAPKKIYGIAFYLDSLIDKAENRKKTTINFPLKTGKNFELPVELLKLKPPDS